MDVHVFRFDLQRSAERVDGPVDLTHFLLRDPQLDDGLHIRRIDGRGSFELLQRLAEAALAAKEHTVTIPQVGMSRPLIDDPFVAIDLLMQQVVVVQLDLGHRRRRILLEALEKLVGHRRLQLQPGHLAQQHAAVGLDRRGQLKAFGRLLGPSGGQLGHPHPHIVGQDSVVQFARPAERLGRLLPAPAHQVLRAGLDDRLEIVRLDVQRLAVVRHGGGVIADMAVQIAQPNVQIGEGRLLLDQAVQAFDGLANMSAGDERLDLIVQERPVLRLHGDGRFKAIRRLVEASLAIVQLTQCRDNPGLFRPHLAQVLVLLDGLARSPQGHRHRRQPLAGAQEVPIGSGRIAIILRRRLGML